MSTLFGIILILASAVYIAYPLFTKRKIPIKGSSEVARPANRTVEEGIEAQILKMRRNIAGVCPKCGAKNPADARFCRLCGTGISRTKQND